MVPLPGHVQLLLGGGRDRESGLASIEHLTNHVHQLFHVVAGRAAFFDAALDAECFATEKPYVFQRFLDAETSLAKKDVFRCFTLCYKFLNAQKVEEAGVS